MGPLVQTSGKRGAKGKQTEMANQETKDLPAGEGMVRDFEMIKPIPSAVEAES